MIIAVCAGLSIIAAWYILNPIFGNSTFSAGAGVETTMTVLMDQKDRSVYMLRDLELDYTTGKLSEEEYNSLKLELSYELAEVIKKIDKN